MQVIAGSWAYVCILICCYQTLDFALMRLTMLAAQLRLQPAFKLMPGPGHLHGMTKGGQATAAQAWHLTFLVIALNDLPGHPSC